MEVKDARYKDNWDKWEHVRKDEKGNTRVDIHFWKNKNTPERIEFKFKNPPIKEDL